MSDKIQRTGGKGATSNVQGKIEHFLRGCFLRGECERLELKQITIRDAKRVYDWIIDEEPDELKTPEAFAMTIEATASEDASGLRGPTQYVILVFRKGSPEYSWRLLFSVRSAMSDDGTFSETEPPDANGLLSMAMRHAEASARTATTVVAQMASHFQKVMAQQDAQLARYEERFVDMTELHENMTARKDERDLANYQAKKSAEHKDALIQQVQLMLPAVAAKFLPAGPSRQLAAVEAIKEFMRSLKPEQVPALMAGLSEGQQAALGTLYQAMKEEAEADEDKGKKGGDK